jgi:hypothetical protein
VRADVAEADRRYEVREAARGWQRAAAIDEETRKKIDAAYPDDRNRLGPVFRVLVFGFSLVVLQSALGIVGLVFASAGESAAAVVFLLFGLGLAGLTGSVGRLSFRAASSGWPLMEFCHAHPGHRSLRPDRLGGLGAPASRRP